jgi:hypothetical protein
MGFFVIRGQFGADARYAVCWKVFAPEINQEEPKITCRTQKRAGKLGVRHESLFARWLFWS